MTSDDVTAITKTNPYIGPRPFMPEDAPKFFGRDGETSELVSMMQTKPIIVLHAQSGAGKTSLLSAMVVPALRRAHCEVIGPLRVRGVVPSAGAGSKNIFLFNALANERWMKSSLDQDIPPLTEFLSSIPPSPGDDVHHRRRVLIFDQFEELFTLYPERWRDRHAFFDEIADAIDADPRLCVVFAMREEYLGPFDSYSSEIAARLKFRFRLERLRREQALEAVNGPLRNTSVRFDPGVDEALVDALLTSRELGYTEEFAEPLHLQLVCHQLWQILPSGSSHIDERTFNVASDTDDALAAYYGQVIRNVSDTAGIREGWLRAWFESRLITDGHRAFVYRGGQTTGDLANSVVAKLETYYLIRSEARGAAIWCELSHDRFIGPIQRSNEEWRKSLNADRDVQILEERAATWTSVAEEERAGLILTSSELERAKRWLASAEGEEIGLSKTAEDLLAVSEAAHERAAAQTLRRKFLVASMVAAICAIAVIAVLREKQNSRTARGNAELDIAKGLADQNRPMEALM